MHVLAAKVATARSRKPLMRRVRLPGPLRLTASQREILSLLDDYGFLTPRLLALAYGSRDGRGGRGYWHLQRELRRLFDAGLVQRFPGSVRPERAGSGECVYAVTHEGGRAILDPEEYAVRRRDLYNRERTERANFDHHVAVATLQLILTLGQSGWRLLEFRAEERNPQACVRVRVKNRILTAWPDAVAVIAADGRGEGAGRPTGYLFEIDLTRKSNPRIGDRFCAYAAYLAERQGEEVPRGQHPTRRDDWFVVFAVPREGEVERFMEHAAGVLSPSWARARSRFLFWNMEDWYERQPVRGAEATATTLKSPARIIHEARLADVNGESRRLVAGE